MDDYTRITTAFNNKGNINYNNFTICVKDQVDVVKPNNEKLNKLCNKWYVKAETYDSKYVMFSELKWYQVIKEIVLRLFGSEGSKDVYKGSTCKKFIDAKFIAESPKKVQDAAKRTSTTVETANTPLAKNSTTGDTQKSSTTIPLETPTPPKKDDAVPTPPVNLEGVKEKETTQIPPVDTTVVKDAKPARAPVKTVAPIPPKESFSVDPNLLVFNIPGGTVIALKNEKDWKQRDSILVKMRESGKPGFGTESTRQIFKKSLELGYGGRFHNDASRSSHLFHLYMGMIPVDRKLDYAQYRWGNGAKALKKYDTITSLYLIDKKAVPSELKVDFDNIKNIVADLKGLDREQITDQMVIDAEADIKALKDKSASYLQDEFIPELLEILERDPTAKQPDTEYLYGVKMVLSDEGIARWNDDVSGVKPFDSFRKLEQLRQYMDETQLARLDAIMAKRFPS
jgi:hypothetical protein